MMNQDLIDMAYDLARWQRANGQKCVMVLFPSIEWRHTLCQEEGIYTRFSDVHSSLKSLAIDTLILVGSADDYWDEDGVRRVKERVRISRTSKILYISGEEVL
jgi:hypothetical protein